MRKKKKLVSFKVIIKLLLILILSYLFIKVIEFSGQILSAIFFYYPKPEIDKNILTKLVIISIIGVIISFILYFISLLILKGKHIFKKKLNYFFLFLIILFPTLIVFTFLSSPKNASIRAKIDYKLGIEKLHRMGVISSVVHSNTNIIKIYNDYEENVVILILKSKQGIKTNKMKVRFENHGCSPLLPVEYLLHYNNEILKLKLNKN